MCLLFKQKEPPTPKGIINQGDVVQSGNEISIKNVPGQIWVTTVANTNSMLPLIDYGDLAVLTDGFDKNQLAIGDVIVYQGHVSIIHRIIDIQETVSGERIYTAKGDNNAQKDLYQILDEHINWLLIGIIYCKKEE